MKSDPTGDDRRLKIKKYPNRRFYDATGSRHLTLGELHDLICEGYELTIVDSQSGDDITNVVLTQIILEREPPKLDIFPPNILHQVIRTKHKLLGSVVEQYFRQVLAAQRASQERWTAFLKNTLGFAPPTAADAAEWAKRSADPTEWARLAANPAEWARFFMPWSAARSSAGQSDDQAPSGSPEQHVNSTDEGASDDASSARDDASEPRPTGKANEDELATLRRQLEALERRVKAGTPRKRKRK